MIQWKVFSGTLAHIEQTFNAWAAGLANGVNVQAGPLVACNANSVEPLAEREYVKEVMYILPVRDNSKIAVPTMVPPRELAH
jgi:hypothetical protein